MLIKPCISVIVPFYNANSYVKKCIECLKNQDIKDPLEIIFVNDGSTDDSLKIIKNIKITNLKIFSLKKNLGPASARNYGIMKSSGEYLFFLDVDDLMAPETLRILYNEAKISNYDYVFCDSKWIENSKNQREEVYSYNTDKIIKYRDLTKCMVGRLYNPRHMGGPLSAKGRLIKRSLINDNKIFYEEKLRYLEDEIFMWDFLANVKSVKYLHKQLYTYYVHPNAETAIIRGLNLGFSVSKFKVIKKHISNSLKKRGCAVSEIKMHSNQSFIYFIINVLVSYSKSILHKKVDWEIGNKLRRKIIEEIINDTEVELAIKNYSVSKKESPLIVEAIKSKSIKLLESACNNRAEEILRLRRKK